MQFCYQEKKIILIDFCSPMSELQKIARITWFPDNLHAISCQEDKKNSVQL
jgi:hypothetical protein